MVICTAAILGSTVTPAFAGGSAVAPAIAVANTMTTTLRLTRPAPSGRKTEMSYSTHPARSLAAGKLTAGALGSEPEAVDPRVEGGEPVTEATILDRHAAEDLPARPERWRRWILNPLGQDLAAGQLL